MTDAAQSNLDSALADLWEAMLAHVPAAVIVHDRNLKIIRANAAFHQMAGHGNEVLGKSPLEFVPEPLLSELGLKEKLRRVRDEGAVIGPEEIRYRTPDGRPVVFWHKAFPVRGADGTVAFVVTLLQDWTEHVQMAQRLGETVSRQQALLREAADTRKAMLFMLEDLDRANKTVKRANMELEERVRERTVALEVANKELEAFAYSVSHDLRAPLRSIDGFSLALAEDYPDKFDAQGQDYIRRVRAATQKMGQLIDGMLQLSRLTRSEMRRAPVDLSAMAGEIVADLRQAEPARRVEFVCADGLTADGDALLLRTAIQNLLANAWKFTGKQLHARIEFGVTEQQGSPAYFVRDNGAGFDMAYAHKLFGAFQRLHGAEEFPGTGIGLATVQRIVHRHGGRVWAEGAVGQGATFYFTLPASAPVREEQP